MPSARALLVASLLTEPLYECLGPTGNDRYRKRSLRSQTARTRKSTAKSAQFWRKDSANNRPVRGRYLRIHRNAFCRKSPRVPRVSWLGSWALGTSNRGGQDKSRKVRTVGWVRNRAGFSMFGTHCEHLRQLAFFDNTLAAFGFCHLKGRS